MIIYNFTVTVLWLACCPQLPQELLEILWKRCVELHVIACGRMSESQNLRVERLSLQPEGAFCRSVDLISQNRMPDTGHMNADLVRSAGFQLTFNICVVPESLKYLIVGDSPAAVD